MMVTTAEIEPISEEEWQKWPNLRMRLATLAASYAPRGRGAIPRFIGKYFGRHMKTTIRTASGAYLAVEPSCLDVYAAICAAGGTWEPRVLNACLLALKTNDVFFDIGANVGFMSIEVATRRRNSVEVIAFEPILALARSILRSARINGANNVRVMSTMLGGTTRDGELFIPSHSIHASAIARESSAYAITCPMTTVDELVRDGTLPPPDVIKIDVEGGELEVFRGASEVIAQHAPTIIFEADVNMERFAYSLRDLTALLSANVTYKFFGLSRDGSIIDLLSPNASLCTEFIAVPPNRPLA